MDSGRTVMVAREGSAWGVGGEPSLRMAGAGSSVTALERHAARGTAVLATADDPDRATAVGSASWKEDRDV